jgi:hypothetical protein
MRNEAWIDDICVVVDIWGKGWCSCGSLLDPLLTYIRMTVAKFQSGVRGFYTGEPACRSASQGN